MFKVHYRPLVGDDDAEEVEEGGEDDVGGALRVNKSCTHTTGAHKTHGGGLQHTQRYTTLYNSTPPIRGKVMPVVMATLSNKVRGKNESVCWHARGSRNVLQRVAGWGPTVAYGPTGETGGGRDEGGGRP